MNEEDGATGRKGERHPEQIRFRRRSTVELTAFRRRVNPFISVAPFYIYTSANSLRFPRGSFFRSFSRLSDPFSFLFSSFLSSYSSFICSSLFLPLPMFLSRRNFRLQLIVLSLLVSFTSKILLAFEIPETESCIGVSRCGNEVRGVTADLSLFFRFSRYFLYSRFYVSFTGYAMNTQMQNQSRHNGTNVCTIVVIKQLYMKFME